KIVNNVAGIGAGIWVESAALNIYNSCIEGNALNQTSGYGGGIAVGDNATVYLEECSFLNNTANPLSCDGGAIGVVAQNSLVTLQQCYFEGNTANDDGNAIFVDRFNSTGTAIVDATECIFATTPIAQNLFRRSDGEIYMTNCGTPQIDGGSTTPIPNLGSSGPQTLGMPTTNCPTNSNPCLLSVLPVELIRFEGYCQDSGVKLEWDTATEHNNDYFILERAGDDGIFKQIGRVNGIGNSNELQSYFYQDRNFNSGLYYYRLVQVDYDGTTTEYSTIAVEYDCGSRDIIISYASNQLYFMNLSAEIDQLSIFNSTGQLVYEVISPDLIGNRIKLDKILSRGIYIVSVVSNNKTSTSKVHIND
ncbi:MAG: T9SS type A sorting domain-containing protein, partial [Bacteroidetes bacterium]